MKKSMLVTILFLGFFNGVRSQSSYQVIEEKLPFNHWATSFTTDIIGMGEEFILYNWAKYIEDHGGTTYATSSERGTTELRSEKVKFPLLDNKEVEIYTRLSPNRTESGVLLTVWIRTEDGTYFSSEAYPKEAKNIKDWLLKFNQNLETQYKKIIHD